MNATQKDELVQARLQRAGIDASIDDARTLRRAELTLQRWAEGECGDSGPNASWAIERDETTGKPYRCVYPYGEGKNRRYPVADRERGALARVDALCKRLGCHYYHQGDPRGCALYVSLEPLTGTNYTRGVGVCE